MVNFNEITYTDINKKKSKPDKKNYE